jgi:poly(3-hydroxyoctanoate) depolymerase
LIYFHGTDVPVDLNRAPDAKYGLYYESQFIKKMLEAGFVVIAPKANSLTFFPFTFFGSVLAWEANISPYSSHFTESRDFNLTKTLFDNLDGVVGAPADRQRIFLAGFSSGGYMSSRIANEPEFAGQVAGVVVHSASYGTCLQGSCSIPSSLPSFHPRTLLVANQDDSVVPFRTVEQYQKILEDNGVPTDAIYSEKGDHAWLPSQIDLITEWLNSKTSK